MTASEWSEAVASRLMMQAASLTDRLAYVSGHEAFDADAAEVRRRINYWCEVVADGDQRLFQKRLAWDGLTVQAIQSAIAMKSLPEGQQPPWVSVVEESIRLFSEEGSANNEIGESFTDKARPSPFEEILAPFVVIACRRIEKSSLASYRLLGKAALNALQRTLLQHLTSVSAPTIYSEFCLFRAQQQSGLTRLIAQTVNSNERAIYLNFIQFLKKGGLLNLILEYAVLARLLGTIVHLWVQSNLLFLQRLQEDAPEIRRTFGIQLSGASLTEIEPALSDPHNNRAAVMGLRFSSDRKLIYKPRGAGLEKNYQNLLTWLNQRNLPLKFKTLKIIDRGSYAWVEHVNYIGCSSQQEVRNYYRRAGMQLCLLYALAGTDLHHENVIASGEQPVLIDLEMLLCHRPNGGLNQQSVAGGDAFTQADELLSQSVLSTGMLPGAIADHTCDHDVSGLAGLDPPKSVFAFAWTGVNSDRMVRERRPVELKPLQNAVLLNGATAPAERYVAHLTNGFESMYRFLMKERSLLLGTNGPLRSFSGDPVRYVHRTTQSYGAFQRRLLKPAYMRDGVEHWIQIDALSRELLAQATRPALWPLLLEEARALEQADVPLFLARADSADLRLPNGKTINGFFKEASFDLACARISGLSEHDLQRQLSFIEGSLARGRIEVKRVVAHERSVPESTPTFSASELVACAAAIGEQFDRQAVRGSDNSATWIAPQYDDKTDRIRFRPLDFTFYDGTSGVVLFLSALAAITRSQKFRDLALAAVQPVCRSLAAAGEALTNRIGLGGGSGLGGILYSLVRTSESLDEPSLLSDARRAAQFLTSDRIVADNALDVMDGAAGAILGLLALFEILGDQDLLDRAVMCGEHLAKQQHASGHTCWRGLEGSFPTGFSHGAAGIVYALLRLYEQTGDDCWRDAASEGIKYEDSLLNREIGNWPELMADKGPQFLTQWCHGAPGIGLSRLIALSILDWVELLPNIDIALNTTIQYAVGPTDHLCCGNFGRIDFLLTAGKHLHRPALTRAAASQAAIVISRAQQTGSFALDSLVPRRIFSPGFFLGMSGIGYEVLRLAYPQRLPSALMWESARGSHQLPLR